MPSTINGIGTTYYGKGNHNSRSGVCEHCKAQAVISSYETRLWFVVFFIPVIPLGKKQILDQCSACTRHRVVPLGEWERVRDEATDEVAAKAGRDPNDPEAAMEMLGTLVAFQKHQEAAKHADGMAARFPDNADVQFQLGAWYETAGQGQKADACFERALQLEPDNRAAARAVGIGCIAQGDLAGARKLLSFMEKPGPEQEPAVLVLLADAFQAAGDHQNAAELYRLAVAGSPSLGHDKGLRKRANASAEALGMDEPIVPEPPKNYNARLFWLAVAALIVVGATVANYYASSNQTLHIVNRLPNEVTVTIDEGEATTVGASRVTVKIAEGEHKAVIRGGDGGEETVVFEIDNSIFQRFSKGTVFVLNVAGAATLIWEETVYTAQPDPTAENPYKIHYGEPFLTFRGIDYRFEEFPNQLETKAKRTTRSRVGVLDAAPFQVMMNLPDTAEMLRFAEHHLAIDPADETLMQLYFGIAMGTDQRDRCRTFLEKGISKKEKGISEKPVSIEWHRMYQQTAESAEDEEAMISRYDQLIEDDPDNSALLYLRGRLAARPAEAEAFFDRAIEADATNAYPYFAKAYYQDSMGKFAEAKELASKALELKPDQIQMMQMLFEIRFALGEYADLEKELKESFAQAPLSTSTQQNLLRVLVADGRADEAGRAHEEFAGKVQGAGPEGPAAATLASSMSLEYLTGDLEAWREAIQAQSDPEEVEGGILLADFELGRLDDLGEGFVEYCGLPGGYGQLLLSLAWREKGNAENADAWREKAMERFASGTLEEALVADLLKKGEALELEEVDKVLVQRSLRTILLVALADAAPGHRRELLARAAELNTVRYFPYQFLKRMIELPEKP